MFQKALIVLAVAVVLFFAFLPLFPPSVPPKPVTTAGFASQETLAKAARAMAIKPSPLDGCSGELLQKK